MSADQLRVVALLCSAAVVMVSGYLLTRRGRPYHPVLLNVHKLVDLAAVIVTGVMVYRAGQSSALSAAEWASAALTAAVFVALFASGGVVSATENPPAWVLWLHRLSPWAAVTLAGVTVYFIVS